jgi:ABC-type cobalamin/Fe3+-siderophores transport system ATPase subunit
MFHNVELMPWKGLKTAKLENLGKINVLCGKNSSGKSTVLECIAEPSRRSPGRVLEPSEIESIVGRTVHGGAGWGTQNPTMDRAFSELLHRKLTSGSIFTHQIQTMCQRIYDERGPTFGAWSFPTPQIENALRSALADKETAVLVPAKRGEAARQNVNANDPVRANGAGLINWIFAAKNSEENTPKRRNFEVLRDAFETVSGGYKFEVFLTADNSVELKFAHRGGSWIPAEACGLGLHEVLLLLFFGLVSDYSVVLLEEPESHLHPDLQRRLILHLRERSEKQLFLATHSNVFLAPGVTDKVFLSRFSAEVVVENVTSRATALHELGYSVADNLVSDLIVLVEGPTDRPALEEFLAKEGLLQNYSIKVWPMGGDIMSQLDLSVFTASYKVIALVDSDPGSGKERKRFEDNCTAAGIPLHRLKRRSIENYFSIEALRQVFADRVPTSLEIDAQKKVSEQIGFEVKRNNAALAKATSREHLFETDLADFFSAVREQLAS